MCNMAMIIFLSSHQAKPKRQRKTREAKAVLTKEIVEDDLTSGDENTSNTIASSSALAPPKRPPKPKPEKVKIKVEGEAEEPKSDTPEDKDKEEIASKEEHRKEKKKFKKEKKESRKKKKPSGPMHFTANSEPRALEIIGDLEPSVFNEVCKVHSLYCSVTHVTGSRTWSLFLVARQDHFLHNYKMICALIFLPDLVTSPC